MPVNFQDRRSDFRGHLVRGGRQERESGVRDLYLLLQSVRQDHDLSAIGRLRIIFFGPREGAPGLVARRWVYV